MTRAHVSPPVAATIRDLTKLVEDGMSAFLAREQARRAVPDPRGAMPVMEIASLARAGGKRLRPVFCLSGYLAAGGSSTEEPVRAAMALELLHIGALIHDDVMDDSDLRRGVPTTHVKHAQAHETQCWQGESRRYGDAIAIMAGLLAWTYADKLMADLSPAVTREWFELRAELVAGQTLDVVAAAEFAADPLLARHIAVVKSGRYTIHRPLVIGATLAGRPELAPAFEVYGEALGEAFQLRDDLIDAFGSASASGKPAGLDFEQHKMTLLLALAMREDVAVRELVERGAFDELRGHLIGVRDTVEDHIADLVRKARTAIGDAPISPEWIGELSAMAGKVAYRDR
ncbi:polyprenyl synthetase family protein [Lentzea tibetensis]|uniref:Polyprenyl synthetase family protein n=1 Tax=Lentzea tibetensis TaxID=2591470 RepID=A0A563ETE2_9PSEU|nr:polyprenyl synthetase family protein [Lentzea tibetensis]TWP50930.1 polyprenyl synthetase family protein [Lentzea tibetensis]